jgi:hypothetical protein
VLSTAANTKAESPDPNVPDTETNRAIREVATTQTAQHIIPATIIARLYQHVDDMRAFFFGGALPEVVLSFDVSDRRVLGHYCIRRNGLGVRWNVNLNPVHLARPVFEVLATLLHELAHTWQCEKGTAGRPPHHNAEFVAKCMEFGIPTNGRGVYLGVRHGSPFERYCREHGIPFPSAEGEAPAPTPEPLLPAPPATPRGSRLRKWVCGCEKPIPVRVASDDFDATCNRCGEAFRRA